MNIYEPPRFFESFLRGREIREVTDITARICGICPVAYQMSAAHALEKALGIEVTPEIRRLRRLLYCGEWIESQPCTSICSRARFPGIRKRNQHGGGSPRGGRTRLAAEEDRKPVAGHHRRTSHSSDQCHRRRILPCAKPRDLKALLPDLQWGLAASIEVLKLVSIRLSQPRRGLRMRVHSAPGGIPDERRPRGHDQRLERAGGRLRAALPGTAHAAEHGAAQRQDPGTNELPCGPLARINLCFDQLSPIAKREAENCGISWPARNNFQSIVARAVEMIDAYEEAIAIIQDYNAEPAPSRVPYEPKPGTGCHATECCADCCTTATGSATTG